MIINCEKTERLKFFDDLYETAKTAADGKAADSEDLSFSEKLKRNYDQYKGDIKIDGSNTPAKVVRNITYELIESQVSSYIPQPQVTPSMWSDANERCAKAIEEMLKNKRNKLPFEKMNDMDERFAPTYGGTIWLIEWDNSILTHNTVGDVKVTNWSPTHFVGQPNIYEISDMEYCFITFETTKDDLVRKYAVTFPEAEETGTTDSETEDVNDTNEEIATVIVCYYKNDEDKVCQFIWSEDTVLADIEDYYNRKIYFCKTCGKRKELCTCDKPKFELKNDEFEELDHDIQLSTGEVLPAMCVAYKDGEPQFEEITTNAINPDGSVALSEDNGIFLPIQTTQQIPKYEQAKIPYYTPSMFPIVVRKNTSLENCILGQSDCEFIRPQQQTINKVESRILEKLMSGGVFPVTPDGEPITLDNSVNKKCLKATQQNYKLYNSLDLTANIQQDLAEADRIYEHAKRILGISDSFQGHYDSSATSGVAKQLQIQQAAGRLESKRRMKNAAYAEIDAIIFQLMLAYADEPRPATFKDAQGKMQNTYFNRYDYVRRDETGEWYYDDQFLFATDPTGDIEADRNTLWQENRQNFQQGAYGDPSQLETQLIFWQNMERAHYPFARDNVERVKQVIEQNIAALQQQNVQLGEENANRQKYEEYLRNFNAGGGQAAKTAGGNK